MESGRFYRKLDHPDRVRDLSLPHRLAGPSAAQTKAEGAAWTVEPGGIREVTGADMAPVDLPWADQAWYGQWTEGEIYVLVVRVGRQVTTLSAWEPLLTEENLAAIQGRLT